MTTPHFHPYQSSYNNPSLQQQFSPSQYRSIQPNQQYSSHYPSQTQFNHSSIPPSHAFQSQMNHQTSTVPQVIPQVAYQSLQAPTQLMTESPFIDSGFAVPVFSPRDDLIACLNKAMTFITAVASSRFPTTNNQLRTSSSPRNQATIQDGRVTVQQVQGRQGQNYSGTTYKGNATSSKGNTTSVQARVVKCYNCQGEGHMARQCTQSKRLRNAAWCKEKSMLAKSQEAGQILDEEQLAFLVDLRILAVFKNESKEKENKYMGNEIDLEKKIKELDNIICKVGQSAQTVHMLTKPQAFYDNTHKQALRNIDFGKKVSRSKCLEKAKDLEVIAKKISYKPIDYEKLNILTEDLGKRFSPQQELSAEQAFWFHILNPTIKPPYTPPVIVDVHSELPKVSLVNASLKKLKFHLTQFDSVVKKRTTPNALEEVNDLKARLQDKDKTICKLKNTIQYLREKTKEENVNHDKCDLEPINKELENSVAKLLSENERKEIVENVVHTPSVTTIAPGMFKLDLVPLPPRLLQNRDAHIDYLRHTQEQVNTLWEIELFVYVQDTCPNEITPSPKKVAITPMNKVKKVSGLRKNIRQRFEFACQRFEFTKDSVKCITTSWQLVQGIVHQCLQQDDMHNGDHVIIPVVPATDNSLTVPKQTTVETVLNMSPENKAHFKSEKEVIHLILTGIRDEIYSTVDACKTTHEMWEAIERLQQGESLNIQDVKTNLFWEFGKFTSRNGETMESYYTRFYKLMNEMIRNNLTVATMQVNVQFLQQLQPKWSRFVTMVKQQHKLDEVSYHKLFDILKQYQKEVNELHAKRIAKNANPLALVAAAQPYQDPQRDSQTNTPLSESASKEDSDPKQAQKDKEMQKNLALIEKYFKKIYKPTNNNLRTSSNTRNKNVDTTLLIPLE
ncbi:retrovirus-related pol polyprotein from transposon TNT 1-94 [Tanacetum coccineum]|uniref:Retrovirus-related pol polyprotein from transposon TNT 1-94 n=1 Tax=Tanacetum coccineum TaxID=301880 RepID=A0ABQ4ZP55_9ASTR